MDEAPMNPPTGLRLVRLIRLAGCYLRFHKIMEFAGTTWCAQCDGHPLTIEGIKNAIKKLNASMVFDAVPE